MLRLTFLLFVGWSLEACAAPPPLGCTATVDSSGRGLPFCNAASDVPVCDAPGAMAHFTGPSTSTLEGGSLAFCDGSNQLVCADAMVIPHCIALPPPPD